MANYLIRSCDNITEYVVNPGVNVITIGQTYFFSFTGETLSICGTVISEDSGSINEGLSSVTEYNDCLNCLQNEGFSAILSGCSEGFAYPQTLGQFPILPTIGDFYKFCDPEGTGPCFCFIFLEFVITPGIPAIYSGGPFSDCNCNEPPRSANTETFLCQEICTSGGTTTISVTPPHPVWTDGYGTPVTQLNMVTLGGMKGLNS